MKSSMPFNFSKKELILRIGMTCLKGQSMYPTLRNNDILFMERASIKEMRLGDLVIFEDKQNDSKFICHRLLLILKNNSLYKFLEKGDNSFNAVWRDAGSLVGRVKGIRREKAVYEIKRKRLITIYSLGIILFLSILKKLTKIKRFVIKNQLNINIDLLIKRLNNLILVK